MEPLVNMLLIYLLLLGSVEDAFSFLLHPAFTVASNAPRITTFRFAGDEIDAFRNMLEASWNSETMGSVPTDAKSAAEAAASAVLTAIDRNEEPVFFVDVLLPQYDITQGPNLYDELLVVEFCIHLSLRMGGKCEVVVKDNKTLREVSRILEAREGGGRAERPPSSPTEKVEWYDEFSELGLSRDESISADSMRSDVQKSPSGLGPLPFSGSAGDRFTETFSTPDGATGKCYRLASMLGDEEIATGADMMDDVVKAISIHGKPRDDEDTLIILSAISKEELYGVRALVGSYKGRKRIIMVNCKLDPIPRELYSAQTVYSILPLIARQTVVEGNIFGSTETQTVSKQPKVVVLRRYPREWELFVDDGKGFELAATIPPNQVDRKSGPSMQWVTNCVKQFLASR